MRERRNNALLLRVCAQDAAETGYKSQMRDSAASVRLQGPSGSLAVACTILLFSTQAWMPQWKSIRAAHMCQRPPAAWTDPPQLLMFRPSFVGTKPILLLSTGCSVSVWHRCPVHAAKHEQAPATHLPLSEQSSAELHGQSTSPLSIVAECSGSQTGSMCPQQV